MRHSRLILPSTPSHILPTHIYLQPNLSSLSSNLGLPDIRTWHANIEQHASEGVNKILIGNKSDWTEKRAVTEEQGRELANELGIKFMETSAKVNEGVEEAFFTLARSVPVPYALTLSPFLPLSPSHLSYIPRIPHLLPSPLLLLGVWHCV